MNATQALDVGDSDLPASFFMGGGISEGWAGLGSVEVAQGQLSFREPSCV
jgi:hypothetical protein